MWPCLPQVRLFPRSSCHALWNVARSLTSRDPAFRPASALDARRLLAQTGQVPPEGVAPDDEARVRLAYLRAYNRPAQEQEVTRARAFVAAYRSDQVGGNVDAQEANVRTWQALCRVILSANEFIFLE